MTPLPSTLPDIRCWQPLVHSDPRGAFWECWRLPELPPGVAFVQANRSRSKAGVLRGLHYQLEQPQGKLLQVLSGALFDVVVDLRRSSPDFGRWEGRELSAENRHLLYVPPGFAHGFYALNGPVELHYLVTAPYHPASERVLAWDDPDVGVRWPLEGAPLLSDSDRTGLPLRQLQVFP